MSLISVLNGWCVRAPTDYTDRDFFTFIFNNYNLWKIKLQQPSKFWKIEQQKILELLQQLIETTYPLHTSQDLAKLSLDEFLTSLIGLTDIDLSKTLYSESIYNSAKNSATKSKRQLNPETPDSGESSTTQKQQKLDTPMSSIAASITDPIVDAGSLETTISSDVDLDTLLTLVKPTQSTSGKLGSSIFYKHQGVSYTWKSPEWTTGTKYVDLKIYNHPSLLEERTPMEMWKEAGLRAKVLLGTRASNQIRTQQIENCLKQLTTLLIAEISQKPDCQSSQRE